MKLTLTLTDDQFRALDETLRISYSAHKLIRMGEGFHGNPSILESDKRILQARNILEMNVCPDRACYNCPEEGRAEYWYSTKSTQHFEITCEAP